MQKAVTLNDDQIVVSPRGRVLRKRRSLFDKGLVRVKNPIPMIQKSSFISTTGESSQNSEDLETFHSLIPSGDVAKIRSLIEQGVDVNAQNEGLISALHVACFCGNVEIVQLLLEEGAQTCVVNSKGRTPLHMACRGGHIKVVECLLKAGCFSFLTFLYTFFHFSFSFLFFSLFIQKLQINK